MTRINLGIPPEALIDQHLSAELYELPRVFTLVRKRTKMGVHFKDIPESFTLGKGHVKFFYNKLGYLEKRYSQLQLEFKRRFSQTHNGELYFPEGKDYPELFQDYTSTKEDKAMLVARIISAINRMQLKPRYRGEKLSTLEAIDLFREKLKKHTL